MSKVFSAKLNSVEFSYELPNGTLIKLKYRSPTTQEIDQSITKDGDSSLEQAKALFRQRLIGTAEEIDALITDQYENGNLYELITELEAALADAKTAKKRS